MNDEVTDRIRQSYDTQNRMHDRVFQQWSDATLGVETYSDPAGGGDIRLPGGYNHAWINRNGEYIVSDNPNFNPNVGSNLSWEELRKKN